jgi:prevent-host-death family protein
MRLGLRAANQHFSTLVKTIKRGEEVILTDRGHPIAVVTPLRTEGTASATLARLAQAGFVRLPTRPGPVGRAKPVRARGTPVSQILNQERDTR